MSQASESAPTSSPATPGPASQRTRRSAILSFVAANQWVLILLLTIGLGIFTGLVNDRFFNPRNIISILEQSSVLGLVAAGATILIISGNFDISVGAIIGLAAVTMAMIVLAGYPEELAMLAGMAVAITCSVVNATLARLFQAPTFIVSLATAGIFTGIALALTEGIIQSVPSNFTFFSSTPTRWAATCRSSSSSACWAM